MRIQLVFLAVLVTVALGQDGEEDRRGKLRTPRGPIVQGRPGKQQVVKASSTTPEPAPEAEDGEAYDEAVYDEEEQKPTTTTEAPKKGIRGGVVRPFRSNTELIEALKRKRAQMANSGSSGYQRPSTTTPPADPVPPKNNRKSFAAPSGRKFSRGSTTEPPYEESSTTQRSRAFAGRGRRF